MGKSKRNAKTGTVATRLRELCDVRFEGNARRMSEAVGVSQAAGWRIISGKQEITAAFLTGLANIPDIDLNWLIRGSGPPPQVEHTVPLPVSREVLPGLPGDHPEKLTSTSFGVSGALFRKSRYWVEVQSGSPITHSAPQKIRASDLLLMDADTSAFPRTHQIRGELCGVQVETANAPLYKLALVFYENEEPGDGAARLAANTFDTVPDWLETAREITLRIHEDGSLDTFQKTVQVEKNSSRRRKSDVTPMAGEPIPFSIRRSDIVCKFVLMVRRHHSAES